MSADPAAQAHLQRIQARLEAAVRGKTGPIRLLLAAVVSGGHVLLEDIPGTGKTTLARSLAAATGCSFKRIQCTPDLLPGDITGSSIFDQKRGRFRFRPGPLMTQIVIVDEINRASPRTQSALLEALAEGQVTVEGRTRPLAAPFLCVATQNPVEFHGTYPLPEASLDRFMLQLSLGYPPEAEERALIQGAPGAPAPGAPPLPSPVTPADILALQAAAAAVRMDASVAAYAHRLVLATRQHAAVRLGASTRGALHLGRAARGWAMLQGRDFVIPEDVRHLAAPVLAHRLCLDGKAKYAGADRGQIIQEILQSTPLPR